MIKTESFAQVEFKSGAALRDWLLENHRQDDSIWAVTALKQLGHSYVSREEILDEILCFGWIDGIRRKRDDAYTMQLLSPRRTQHWAKSYKDRAAKLIEEGLMHASGFQAIETAKANGLWTFMDDVDALILPDDLKAALRNPDTFETYAPSYRRNVLRWIKLAKTDATRNKRIAKVVESTKAGVKIPQM